LKFCGDGAEVVGHLAPLIRRSGVAHGDDEFVVAKSLVEIHLHLEAVSLEGRQAAILDMGAAGLEAVVIQHLPQLRGGFAGVSGEFDAIIADLLDGSQRAGDVSIEIAAHGIQLDADGQFLVGGGHEAGGTGHEGGGSGCGGADEFASGELRHK